MHSAILASINQSSQIYLPGNCYNIKREKLEKLKIVVHFPAGKHNNNQPSKNDIKGKD